MSWAASRNLTIDEPYSRQKRAHWRITLSTLILHIDFVDIANARHSSSLLGSALAYCNIALLLFLGHREKR